MKREIKVPVKIDKILLKDKLEELAKVLTERKITAHRDVLEEFKKKSPFLEWKVVEVKWGGFDEGFEQSLPLRCRKSVFRCFLVGKLDDVPILEADELEPDGLSNNGMVIFDFTYGIDFFSDTWVQYWDYIRINVSGWRDVEFNSYFDPYYTFNSLIKRIDSLINHNKELIVN